MHTVLRRLVKRGARTLRERAHRRRHRRKAAEALAIIEAQKGSTEPAVLRLCDEYAEHALGWAGYAPWLYVYGAVAGEFREGWIPDDYYGRVVVPAINGGYRGISSLKSLTGVLFDTDALPDRATFVNGRFRSARGDMLDEQGLAHVLFRSASRVIYKMDASMRGIGVFAFDEGSFDVEKVKELGDGVFQEYVAQHPLLRELSPSAVATLRLTTVIGPGGLPSIRGSYLRLGRASDPHVRSATHVRVAVDATTGCLSRRGYLADWREVEGHPDTAVAFRGRRVPSFAACTKLAKELHAKFPYPGCLGWDLTVDTEGRPKLLEWNGGHNDIKFTEATQGPGFSDLGWGELWKATGRVTPDP